MSRVRRAAAAVLATGVTLGAAGCGNTPTTQAPSSKTTSSAPSPSPSPTETSPTASPTTPPISRFERNPAVKASRVMAARLGHAVNHGDRTMSGLGNAATPHGRQQLAQYNAQEIGHYFPGPQPFTPVRVRTTGSTAVVSACWFSYGWSQNKQTRLPAHGRQVDPANIYLKRVAGRWQVDDVLVGKTDCKNVPVKGYPW